jgi:hypothetical protein
MIGRIAFGLLAGLAIGVILAGLIVFAVSRPLKAPTQARGDVNGQYDLALTLTESFLASQMNNPQPDVPGVTTGKAKMHDASVRLLPDGTMQVRGTTTVLGLPTSVRVVLLPRVVDGQLQMAVVEGRAGAFGIPAGVADDVQATINRQLRTTLSKNNVTVVAIDPAEGMLTIRLK